GSSRPPPAPPRCSSSSRRRNPSKRKSSSTFRSPSMVGGSLRGGIFRGVILIAVAAAVLAGGVPAQAPEPMSFKGKIDPRVLVDTRNGATAHFMVVMRDQENVAKIAESTHDR